MESTEMLHKEEISGVERVLRWMLMLMLGAVFVVHFLPGTLHLLAALPKTPDRAVLIQQGFALLLVITTLALLAERTWAFLLLYISAIAATLLMGISLVPWVVGLLRPEQATEGVIAANLAVLIFGAFCHWLQKNRSVEDLS